MTYNEKIERLFARFPSYQKVGGRAYKMGVDSMMAFDELLDHPHRMYPVIHIAGTNGKGSVSSMLAAALSGSGRRVLLLLRDVGTPFQIRIVAYRGRVLSV